MLPSRQPKVSIVLPFNSGSKYLRFDLYSISAQAFLSDNELISETQNIRFESVVC
jgi:hypothetical protein